MSIVSLSDYKAAIGETDAGQDGFHQLALDTANQIVLNWTDRDFDTPNTSPISDKTYSYDGSTVLNIDDCTTVSAVTFQGSSTPINSNAWRARSEGPVAASSVYDWLQLPVIDWDRDLTSMGAMGFTYNLDQFILQGGLAPVPGFPGTIDVTVTAVWGWPQPPPKDVQRATIITAQNVEALSPSSGQPGSLASKSVAETAESFFAAQAAAEGAQISQEPVPPTAQAILAPYQRH
jgi:hypothetical protein